MSHIKAGVNVHVQQCVKNHKKNVACNEKTSTFNHFDCKAKMVKGSVHTKHKIINQFLVGFESSEKFWFYVFWASSGHKWFSSI